MKKIIYFVSTLIALFTVSSCTNNIDIDDSRDTTYSPTEEGVLLKNSAEFPIGIGVDYASYINDAQYKAIVDKEADVITIGYHMKHGAIVKSDGTIDFTKPDQLVTNFAAQNIDVFGHTLIWHQNNNRDYLKSLVTLTQVNEGEDLIPNGTFESGITGWNKFNGAADALSHVTGGNNVHSGTGGMKIVNASDNAGGQWRTQIQTSFKSALVEGKRYKLTFWIRSVASGGGRCSTSGVAQYQGDFETSSDWKQITWEIASAGGEAGLCFDMGAKAGTYFVDDVVLKEQIPTGTLPPAVVAANKTAVDNAMKAWINNMATHYKGKVVAWDVVNEPMGDGNGAVRPGELPTSGYEKEDNPDVFYWQYYLGRDYAVNAFKYAKAADPSALLFINDYNLESNAAKLDSLINYVKEIEAKGGKIDGIGTQMHITYNQYNFDEMFQKLAATGKLIKISELDIKLNTGKVENYVASEQMKQFQAVAYEQVVKSYLKNVPAAQRYGITFWGVTDADSWITNDAPCLWDAEYARKPAYTGSLKGIQSEK